MTIAAAATMEALLASFFHPLHGATRQTESNADDKARLRIDCPYPPLEPKHQQQGA